MILSLSLKKYWKQLADEILKVFVMLICELSCGVPYVLLIINSNILHEISTILVMAKSSEIVILVKFTVGIDWITRRTVMRT